MGGNEMGDRLFSIVVCYNNTEKYIREAIGSVIKQTIGFEENVELILVNDNSSDNSKIIADFFQNQFPHNIKSVNSLGKGVAAAKNTGLEYVTGKYINFLDSDDMLSSDALENVIQFFDDYQDVRVVSIPMEYFGNNKGDHPLNDKFTSSRVVNINVEPQSIQLSSASAFFQSDLLKSYIFNEELVFGEDSLLLTQIILKLKKYGLENKSRYYYRKRADNSSLTQNTYTNVFYYTKFLEEFIDKLIYDYTDEKLPLYLQYVIAYNIQWPLRKQEVPKGISNEIIEEFIVKVTDILKLLDDEVINSLRYISKFQKWYLFSLKYDFDLEKPPIEQNGQEQTIVLNGKVYQTSKDMKLRIIRFSRRNSDLHIAIQFATYFPLNKFNFFAKIGKKKYDLEPSIERNTKVLGKQVRSYATMTLKVPISRIDKIGNIGFFAIINGQTEEIYLDKVSSKKFPIVLRYKRHLLSISYNRKDRKIYFEKSSGFYDMKAISKTVLKRIGGA